MDEKNQHWENSSNQILEQVYYGLDNRTLESQSSQFHLNNFTY